MVLSWLDSAIKLGEEATSSEQEGHGSSLDMLPKFWETELLQAGGIELLAVIGRLGDGEAIDEAT